MSRESWLCLKLTELLRQIDMVSSEERLFGLHCGNCFSGGGQERQLSLKQFCLLTQTAFPLVFFLKDQGVLIALRKKCF